MAADTSRSGASVDSYIGSLISLTSKSEIRYEGILYNINTEESSIGLRNVRSFGTEGRKDGPQVPASDKIYDYILFRGSDIKDLQVKSSPQTTPVHDDPAIIQSHYPRPASLATSLPPAGSGTVADLSSQAAQFGLPRPTFQSNLPLYQPVGSLPSWGSTPPPPSANGSGLAMPMLWQGYYAPSGGLPHLQPPPLLRPLPGMSVPHSMQQPLQYPGLKASASSGYSNLPEFPPPLLPPASSTLSFTSTSLQSTSAPTQATALAPEALQYQMPSMLPVTSLTGSSLGANLPIVPSSTSSLDSIVNMSQMQSMPSLVSSNPRMVPGPTMAHQVASQAKPSGVRPSSSNQTETSVALLTPGQLLQPGPSVLPSSQPLQTSHKDTYIKPAEAKTNVTVPQPLVHASAESKAMAVPQPLVHASAEAKTKTVVPQPLVHASAEVKEPLLPLPRPVGQKTNGAASHMHYEIRGRGRGRGRERGRGNGYSRPVTKFTEEFDFTAMNEKFKKDEVWGHLGKNKDDEDCDLEEDDAEAPKIDIKPIYVKDDFFDSLSSTTHDRGAGNGRTKFSEQLKIDTETFGDFPRNRLGGRGGRGPRGGGHTRGSYYGRGYGYAGRGRGHVPNRPS